VIDFVVNRYGDFVLLNPPFKATTYVLWIGPGVIAILGLLAVVVFFRRRRATAGAEAPPPLSDEEKKRLQALLEDRSR
jgi:cytochrome c-type biogenesis protein CcmH